MSVKIIKQLTNGNEELLDSLIREYYPKIYSYLYRRLINEALAKDLTQETFYRFFAHLNDYQDHGKLLNYLYRIAQRLLYDDAKTKKVISSELIEEVSDDTYDGYVILNHQEDRTIVRKWIKQLPVHLQDIIYLRYYENLKFKDISNITGIHVSTLKSQMKLALEMLEKKAKKEEWK